MSKDYLSKPKMAEQLRWLEERQTIHSDEVENKQLRIELAKLKQQLAIAVDDLYVIANNANPDFNRMEYAEKSLQKIKELNK